MECLLISLFLCSLIACFIGFANCENRIVPNNRIGLQLPSNNPNPNPNRQTLGPQADEPSEAEFAGCGIETGDDYWNRVTRAIYGEDADGGQFPWFVTLIRNRFLCGAVSIDDRWLVTASSCFLNYTTQQFIEDPGNATEAAFNLWHMMKRDDDLYMPIDRVIHYSTFFNIGIDWNFWSKHAYINLAMVRLKYPLSQHKDFHLIKHKWRPLCIADKSMQSVWMDTNAECRAAGFGSVLDYFLEDYSFNPNRLQWIKGTIATKEECLKNLGGPNSDDDSVVSQGKICLLPPSGHNSSLAFDDTGSPVQCRLQGKWYLAGIASGSTPRKLSPNDILSYQDKVQWVESTGSLFSFINNVRARYRLSQL